MPFYPTLSSGYLPPAQPTYVFRGHGAAVHSLKFIRNNARLVSGDADGWIVVWSVSTRRPVAVWRAHDATILGIESWDNDKLITHGRDGKICVWSMSADDENELDKDLPLDSTNIHRKQPWLLYVLLVSSVNFCAFASLISSMGIDTEEVDQSSRPDTGTDLDSSTAQKKEHPRQILIAVPSSTDSQIDIHELPSTKLVAQIPGPPRTAKLPTGMVMALRLYDSIRSNTNQDSSITLIAGYENGLSCAYRWTRSVTNKTWEIIYTSETPHSQPVLSLDVSLSRNVFYTASADALVCRHPLSPDGHAKEVATGHAGQQGLVVRSDGKVFATAGWDSKVRVYSGKTCNELAVLKLHKDGVYATAFAEILDTPSGNGDAVQINSSGQDEATVSEARERRAQETHWLAAGAKDGKISLWNIY